MDNDGRLVRDYLAWPAGLGKIVFNAKRTEIDVVERFGYRTSYRQSLVREMSDMEEYIRALNPANGTPATVSVSISTSYKHSVTNEEWIWRYIIPPATETTIPYILGLSPTIDNTSAVQISNTMQLQSAIYCENAHKRYIDVVFCSTVLPSVHQTVVDRTNEIGIMFQAFSAKEELQTDPFDHVLSPELQVMTAEEAERYERETGIMRQQLPKERISHYMLVAKEVKKKTDKAPNQGSVIVKLSHARHGCIIRTKSICNSHRGSAYTIRYRMGWNNDIDEHSDL